MVAPFFSLQGIMQPTANGVIQTASHFLRYTLVGQLYAKVVYFCSFVTKSN